MTICHAYPSICVIRLLTAYELLLKYGAQPRPEKPLTPPPEPEVVAPSEPAAADSGTSDKDNPVSSCPFLVAKIGWNG